MSPARIGYSLNSGELDSKVNQIYHVAMPSEAARWQPSGNASRLAAYRASCESNATLFRGEPYSPGSSCPGSDEEDGIASSQANTERNTRPTQRTDTTEKSVSNETVASKVAKYDQVLKAGLTAQRGRRNLSGVPSAVGPRGGSGSDVPLTIDHHSRCPAGDNKPSQSSTADHVETHAGAQAQPQHSSPLREPSINDFYSLTNEDVAEEVATRGGRSSSGYH